MSKFAKTFYSGVGRTRSVFAFMTRHTLALNVATTCCVLLFAAAYIVQVNGSVAKGYAIREVEDHIKALTLANQKMEVTVREAQSLENVARNVKMLGLVTSESPSYVNAGAASVALAQ